MLQFGVQTFHQLTRPMLGRWVKRHFMRPATQKKTNTDPGNPRWEKRLLHFLQRTKIGRIGPDLFDDEVRRVTRYEGWTDLVPDERLIDGGELVADHILDTSMVRQTWFGHWAQCLNLSQQQSSSAFGFLFFLFYVYLSDSSDFKLKSFTKSKSHY
jgi:hypothetical protein